MDISHGTRTLIKSALRKKGVTKKELADAVGLKQSWVTKLMNGTLKRLSDDQERAIESLLGIKLRRFVANAGPVSQMAVDADASMKRDRRVAQALEALLELENELQACCTDTPKWVETKQMTKVGQEIIKIAFANDDKPGKVAREVLKLLA